jgi:hypothetical protein
MFEFKVEKIYFKILFAWKLSDVAGQAKDSWQE